ncbi:MAG: hypothetical protein ACOYMA_21690 [Bacteroidia bacterium]
MRNYILIFLCIIGALSCHKNLDKKDSPTIIDIKFIDYFSSRSVPNLRVKFSNQKFSGTLIGSPINILDTFETDSNGKMKHSFQNTENYLYDLKIVWDNKHFQTDDIYVKTGEINDQTIRIKKFNITKFNLSNLTNKYSTIEVTILKSGGSYSGSFKDTVIALRSVPEDSTRVNINLSNINLNVFKYIDTILFIPNVDTTVFTFKY